LPVRRASANEKRSALLVFSGRGLSPTLPTGSRTRWESEVNKLMSTVHTVEMTMADGRVVSIETGKLAKQASGAVVVRSGDTVILATATMGGVRGGIDFFPLTCDYEERKYAVGKIPGGFVKRGGRPSEKAVLTSRLIDRPLRPLFEKGMRNDVQVIAMPLSADMEARSARFASVTKTAPTCSTPSRTPLPPARSTWSWPPPATP